MSIWFPDYGLYYVAYTVHSKSFEVEKILQFLQIKKFCDFHGLIGNCETFPSEKAYA